MRPHRWLASSLVGWSGRAHLHLIKRCAAARDQADVTMRLLEYNRVDLPMFPPGDECGIVDADSLEEG
jgi:hypothetical protein